jgi:N-acetylglucosaminyl-diphospho-decaprenol L-rhamnosyltransferase
VRYLRECIASIYEYTRGVDFEVIVVDNASPERDVETLKAQFPDINVIISDENMGFARANNLAFRHSSGKYLLFLNPDTQLVTPAITLMLEQARSLSNAGIVGCKLLNSDLSIQTESIQTFPTLLNQLLDIEYIRLRWPACPLWQIAPLFKDIDGPARVEVISGACQLLKREVFEAAGQYSEDYFMYAEDIDLNYKVARLGLGNYYVGNAITIHHGGRSSTQQTVSQWATRMKFRAMMIFFRKTRGRMYAILYRAGMAFAAASRVSVLMLAFPLVDIDRKNRVRVATAKWRTVLKCAVGLDGWAS